ncbi:MAG TPA: HD domain-containing protein [Casimicrobiaceae bacterium]|nr:HD domain-containing protein [Casimicrobiaceae bacterium]
MVAVLHAAPREVAAWLETLRTPYGDNVVRDMAAAWQTLCDAAGDERTSDGEPLTDRALGTATILAGLRLDPATLRAGLLHPLPTLRGFNARAFAEREGDEVAGLVNGVARMTQIRAMPPGSPSSTPGVQAENLRKMLLPMLRMSVAMPSSCATNRALSSTRVQAP